eukprot:2516511-Alexandrium_andersonii.AAC.1
MREVAQNAPLESFEEQFRGRSCGPTQFKLRAPEASLQFPHGGLWIEAECSNDGPDLDSTFGTLR